MSNVTITIDGKDCQAQEGEFILNVARANDIFIPAICYLTRCSPTLACRICLVEADGKQVYACNAKAKEGMQVTTTTDTIADERKAIMEVYDVNHPLECGVCDQSGECELQNYTLDEKIDTQNYTIPDTFKPVQKWSEFINYDPALCIVCERCTTACKDMIGDAAIKTTPRDGHAIDEDFKANMPKDAYAMWNKLNKSLIAPTAGETLDCTNCGECIAVCPVGAIVSSDFQYKTNAWELKQVPATCSHCSAGCQVIFEKKHTSIETSEDRLYRVKNDWNYQTLCGAGRFGFDFENRVESKDEAAFAKAVEAVENADHITFNSTISNEEAHLLQTLKETLGLKLINKEAYSFNAFLENYAAISGVKVPSATLKTVHASDFVISVGSAIKTDNPGARFAINNSMTMNKGAGIYFHPIEDSVIAGLGKSMTCVKHDVGVEEAVMYLILDLFANKETLPKDVADYIASFHSLKTITVEETIKEKVVEIVKEMKLNEETGEEEEVEVEKSKMVPKKVSKEIEVDDNKLLELVGTDANFMEALEKSLKKKENFTLMVGEDFYGHQNSKNLARLAALVEKYSDFSLVVIPPKSNSLGVSLICDLDETAGSKGVGYNVASDFTLSSFGKGDLDMPAFNQQEGTLTTANHAVVPTNAALVYNGYTLNDICNAVLGQNVKYTIDHTQSLAKYAGFQAVEFDSLPNEFGNDQSENRGYILEAVTKKANADESVTNIVDAIKANIYLADPVLQFGDATAKTSQLNAKGGVSVSAKLAESLAVVNGDSVTIEANSNKLTLAVEIDSKIDGEIAFVNRFDSSVESYKLFNDYRFNQATIEKV